MKQVVLPFLVLLGLDLVAGITLFGQAQAIWLFSNAKNWVQVTAELAFMEGVVCLLISGLTVVGVGEHRTIMTQIQDGAAVDVKQYEVQRERSIGTGLQFAAIGGLLIALTVLLTVFS